MWGVPVAEQVGEGVWRQAPRPKPGHVGYVGVELFGHAACPGVV